MLNLSQEMLTDSIFFLNNTQTSVHSINTAQMNVGRGWRKSGVWYPCGLDHQLGVSHTVMNLQI